jgi:hypothetical protein
VFATGGAQGDTQKKCCIHAKIKPAVRSKRWIWPFLRKLLQHALHMAPDVSGVYAVLPDFSARLKKVTCSGL